MSTRLAFVSSTMREGLPPGPRMPSALQAIAWARRPLGFLERSRARYGDTFTLRVRHTGTWVILSDPEDVKRVFTADHATLGVGLANSVLGPLLGPRSVMLLEEPEHIRRRKLMLPPFHGQRMTGYSEMMDEVTRREIARWPIGTPFELWPRMREITLEVIMRVTFGPVDTPELRHLREVLRRLTDWMNDPRRLTLLAAAGPRWLAGNGDYREMMGPVEEAVLAEVRRRRENPPEPGSERAEDIASMLAEARYEDGMPMTEQDLRDEIVTLLTDGPTSTLLSWVFERILRHPDKLARLREEVRAGEEDSYLDAVVKETMRLCPGAPIVVRRILEPMELGGFSSDDARICRRGEDGRRRRTKPVVLSRVHQPFLMSTLPPFPRLGLAVRASSRLCVWPGPALARLSEGAGSDPLCTFQWVGSDVDSHPQMSQNKYNTSLGALSVAGQDHVLPGHHSSYFR